MNKMQKSTLLLFCVVLILASGCALLLGAGAGAGMYAFIEGNLKTTYEKPMSRVWDASKLALEQLGMTADTQKNDAASGTLQGTMADDREFVIALTRVSSNKTEVGIRIGLGDRKVSELIHSKIAENLRE